MDVSKLYPSIAFPVSRGTPMLSPLIKWDHSENYFVPSYDLSIARSERRFEIDIADSDFEFVNGHAIDGKNKFCIISLTF